MSETRNIVVLGASFGGLSAAHYLAKHTLPQLVQSKDAHYELHLVDPSTHFWWHISAPRAICSTQEIKHSDYFFPTMDGFKQYPDLKDRIVFHHGEAAGLDTNSRTVKIRAHSGGEQTLEYYALIIATGVRSQTPLTTLQGDHTISTKALDEMNTKLASAKEIIVGGGGPVGVETAGELGEHLKGKAKVTLITGSDKLLPILRKSLSDKAQKQLEKVGVTVKYNTKISSHEQTSDGKTNIILDNGQTMTADIYIPAIGTTPNTEWLPANLKTSSNFVKTNAKTLRVDDAGSRVYAVGDVSGVDRGGVLNLYNSFPVAAANISHDLLADAKTGSSAAEKSYQPKDGETQFVPVGAKTGVGAFNGWQLPGFIVSKAKGKDYLLSQMSGFTEGKKWNKAVA